MKDMIQKMTDIETEEKSKKQQINEAASMNISMTGDDASQVGQLMAMIRNAGMDPKPVGGDMPLPMRKDIDKFRGIVGAHDDDPNIPGKDDVPGDQDLKAGIIGGTLGSLAGGAAGNVLGQGLGQVAGDALAGAMGGVGTTMGDIGMQIGKAAPGVGGALAGGMIGDKLTGEADGDYANSPDEKYSSARDVTNPPTNDINKSKKSYPKVAGGDNPMALKNRIKEELSALYKEYK